MLVMTVATFSLILLSSLIALAQYAKVLQPARKTIQVLHGKHPANLRLQNQAGRW